MIKSKPSTHLTYCGTYNCGLLSNSPQLCQYATNVGPAVRKGEGGVNGSKINSCGFPIILTNNMQYFICNNI